MRSLINNYGQFSIRSICDSKELIYNKAIADFIQFPITEFEGQYHIYVQVTFLMIYASRHVDTPVMFHLT